MTDWGAVVKMVMVMKRREEGREEGGEDILRENGSDRTRTWSDFQEIS